MCFYTLFRNEDLLERKNGTQLSQQRKRVSLLPAVTDGQLHIIVIDHMCYPIKYAWELGLLFLFVVLHGSLFLSVKKPICERTMRIFNFANPNLGNMIHFIVDT